MKKVYLACVLALSSTMAISGPLRLISDERSVSSGGSASTITRRDYFDGSPSLTTEEKDEKPFSSINHPSNGFGLFEQSAGVSLRTAYASVDGQGYQVSTLNSDGFSFRGVADVLVSAQLGSDSQPDYSDSIDGHANAVSAATMSFKFAVDTATEVKFTGNHSFYGGTPTYNFAGDNGFVWDDQGESSFSTLLTLAPGTYTFGISLMAGSDAFAESRDARATADFSLTAVPEPGVLAMLLPGMLLIGAMARRRSSLGV